MIWDVKVLIQRLLVCPHLQPHGTIRGGGDIIHKLVHDQVQEINLKLAVHLRDFDIGQQVVQQVSECKKLALTTIKDHKAIINKASEHFRETNRCLARPSHLRAR